MSEARISNLLLQAATLPMVAKYPDSNEPGYLYDEVRLLLQAFLNSNSQVNGHTDHGGARGAPPVAEKATRASGSGRQETSL